jgi:hypothetical protein
MYCQYCGHKNPDTAETCGNCGCSPTLPAGSGSAPPPTTGAPQPPQALAKGSVPNYLVWSILATLCCCIPGGIAAIVYSTQVDTKLALGDYAGAVSASDNAKLWCWISAGVGFVVGVLSFFAGLAGGANQY